MRFKNRFGLLFFFGITIVVIGCGQHQEEKSSTETAGNPAGQATATQPPHKRADSSRVIGDWQRTDGGYELKIAELLGNGTLKAGYFNPRPINVSKAMWVWADDFLRIYIELKDVNYPGSNYTLTYLPAEDMFSGKYYQAVEGATYDVSFTRKK